MSEPAAIAAAVLALLALGLWWLLRSHSAEGASGAPPQWSERLQALVPQAALVPENLRSLYRARVEEFLRRKRFIGCDGLVLTDDMRIAVAGLASLLSLRPDERLFPAVRSVLLYPDAFLVHHAEPDEFGLVSDEPVEQIGESWDGERVILSWADVQAALDGDEVNVVAHEFAHQLDDESPEVEGAPQLNDYTRWSTVMQREFERLQRHRRPAVLDPYGAESPGEFFGVVTEAFFQRPQELRRHHAELYRLLADFYRLDPAPETAE